MFRMVSDWRASGKSKKQYCREMGMAYSKFRYWCALSKGDTVVPRGFVPLDAPPGRGPVEVVYPNGVRLRVDSDLGLLSRLIHLY